MLRIALSAISASLLVLTINAGTAQAQTRVFVAAQGLDSNPCTFALPCRTFQHAHDVVAAKGEIDVLDPAGYGAVTITKSISIQGHGFSGISAAAGDAVTINGGSSDVINLRGLLIDGVGTGGNAIKFNTGASLAVQDSVLRDFRASGPNGNGILFAPTGFSKLSVSNTLISENSFVGIQILQPSGSNPVTVVVDRVEISKNQNGFCICASTGTGTIDATISDSVIAQSNSEGVLADGTGTLAGATIMVRHSTIAYQGQRGVRAVGASIIRVTQSTITGNSEGLLTNSGGVIESFGDNALRGNSVDGTPTTTVVLQ